jgi:hypothetical protein
MGSVTRCKRQLVECQPARDSAPRRGFAERPVEVKRSLG